MGRVIRLGGCVARQVVRLANAVRRRRLHLPDGVLRVHRAPVIRVRVAVVHVAHVDACRQRECINYHLLGELRVKSSCLPCPRHIIVGSVLKLNGYFRSDEERRDVNGRDVPTSRIRAWEEETENFEEKKRTLLSHCDNF